MDGLNELLARLARFRWRLRLRETWLLAQRALWIALLAGGLILLAGRIWPVENLPRWAALPLAAWLVLVPGYALLRPRPPMRVARRVDLEAGLKERLSTSLALRGLGERVLPETLRASFTPALVEQVHADALHAAQTLRPEKVFPLRWLRRPLLMAAGLALAAALLIALPNPMDAVLAERAAVAREAETQAARIDELREEIAGNEELSPEEREEMLRRLEELARQLRENPGSRETALADLSRAEEALRERLQPNAEARAAALQALAAQLRQLAGNQAEAAADLSTAAEDLQELAEQIASMSPEEREALAQQLAQLAGRAGQAGDASLAQALAALAQAAQQGDAQQAENAAQSGQQALADAQRQLASQDALRQALAQMQSSRQAVSRAGQSGAQANTPGQGPGQGQGQNPGVGPGQGSGAPGGGGGANTNTLPPGQSSGQVKPPTGSRPGQEGADLSSGQVYVPRGDGTGEIFIPGVDTGQGTTEERDTRDPLPGAPNPALVPYSQVYQEYLQAAGQALEESYIPGGLKDYIQAYFEALGGR